MDRKKLKLIWLEYRQSVIFILVGFALIGIVYIFGGK